jgi:hypothetical protein
LSVFELRDLCVPRAGVQDGLLETLFRLLCCVRIMDKARDALKDRRTSWEFDLSVTCAKYVWPGVRVLTASGRRSMGGSSN